MDDNCVTRRLRDGYANRLLATTRHQNGTASAGVTAMTDQNELISLLRAEELSGIPLHQLRAAADSGRLRTTKLPYARGYTTLRWLRQARLLRAAQVSRGGMPSQRK